VAAGPDVHANGGEVLPAAHVFAGGNIPPSMMALLVSVNDPDASDPPLSGDVLSRGPPSAGAPPEPPSLSGAPPEPLEPPVPADPPVDAPATPPPPVVLPPEPAAPVDAPPAPAVPVGAPPLLPEAPADEPPPWPVLVVAAEPVAVGLVVSSDEHASATSATVSPKPQSRKVG
jgi:hypothetical protein